MLTHHLTTCGSTNDEAARLAAAHPGEAVLVHADEQTGGRGRSGRAWRSPRGGAWFSVAFPVEDEQTWAKLPGAPLLAGLAVLQGIADVLPPPPEVLRRSAADDAMLGCCTRGRGKAAQRRAAEREQRGGERLQLKWPNDVLLDGKKVAGVLCERVACGEKSLLIVGVGINANVDPAGLGDVRFPATSLRAAASAPGRNIDVAGLIRRCAHRIESSLTGLAEHGLTVPGIHLIEAHLAWVNERVSFTHGTRQVEGVLRGIDERGRLLVGDEAFDAGDVTALIVSR